jgi:hypothetical protein
MSSYTYPLSGALAEYLAIQPNPDLIEKTDLVAYSKLDPGVQAKIAPLLKAGVPGTQAKTLAQGDPIKYRTVIAMLSAGVALAQINTDWTSISAYPSPHQEAILVGVEAGLSFAVAKSLVDRLK